MPKVITPNGHGTKHHSAKLDNQKVRVARRRFASGKYTIGALAALYGVSWTSMRDVVTGQTWKHVV